MYRKPPVSLGPPSGLTQSSYYPGFDDLSFKENKPITSRIMEELSILPENTRLEGGALEEGFINILQASIIEGESMCSTIDNAKVTGKMVRLVKGDHKVELARINAQLEKAYEATEEKAQRDTIRKIQESFLTGDLSSYKESQRIWVKSRSPPVETVIGFVEPYRDPLGLRSEFEGIVGIANIRETRILKELSNMADTLVCRLPWVRKEQGYKGPFEKSVFESPDFTSLQSEFHNTLLKKPAANVLGLAYCSSIVFPGINLPNVS